MKSVAVTVAFAAVAAEGSAVNQESAVAANPIRKVVTMLQSIEKKVRAEGEAEKDLFDKYMCYCKHGAADLSASISAAGAHAPEVASAIKEAESSKTQLDADLKNHQADRAEAKATMEKAGAVRAKEAKAFAKVKSDLDTNIAALNKAVSSLESGMGGSFLQTNTAQLLKNLFQTQAEVSDADRDSVLAFLSGGAQEEGASSYSPQSGQITGILKQLGDDMEKSLSDATAAENDSIKSFEELMAAKTKEVNALTAAIEDKTIRSGETAVKIVMMKKDLTDTQAALIDDQKFLADLDKNCATKEAEWAVIEKTRAEELVAISETIKMLNDDDALELFKKTLPSAASSFVQVESKTVLLRNRAMAVIRAAQSKLARPSRTNLDLVMLALNGKKEGFGKVIKMIDTMIGTLKEEQKDDDNKKDYCSTQLDATDDKKKGLEQAISDSEAAIADAEEGISTLKSEIKALNKGIKDLDKSVAEATEQRQKENSEYTELMSSNTAAVDILGMAKNRLQKFYNPALYVPPPKRELSEEDRITVSMGGTAPPTPAPGGIAGTGVTAFADVSAHDFEAPAPPPQAPSAFKKAEETTGVISMMDLLIKDLNTEMQEAETAEKDAQRDYEEMAGDAASKRAADSASVTEKTAALANTEEALQTHTDAKTSQTKELLATLEFMQALHAECDWIMQHYDVRKDARASEVEALGKAKAVLSGADYSLLQTNLRGAK
jgi:chromosome segregation ATPase